MTLWLLSLLTILGCTDPDGPGSKDDTGPTSGTADSGDTDNADGTLPDPDPDPASDALWDPRGMPAFYLTTDWDDWETELRALADVEDECERRPYASVDVTFYNPQTQEEEVYEDVGWRYRGHSALDNFDEPYERVGFKLSFNEFVDGRRFQDLRKINLLGTEGDYSSMREHLALMVMRDMGVPAPRSTYALLYINGELQGVFPNTEEADDEPYLEHHFDSDDGSLYKAEGYCGWKADFDYEGDEPRYYEETYVPKAKTVPEDMYDDLIPMIECVNQESDADFSGCIDDWIDVDEWLTEMAVDASLPDVDGMLGAGQNFMLYREPDGRFVVYPWDKDLALSVSNMAEDWTIADFHPVWNEEFHSLLGARLIALNRDAYCGKVLAVAERTDPDVLGADQDALMDFLSPFVDADPFLELERWGWNADDNSEVMVSHHADVLSQAQACDF